MNVAILAGGLGTRLAEETEVRPKPMIEIGSRPILWHILKHFARYGHRRFYIALGYKGETIKRFFLDYLSLEGDMVVDLKEGGVSRLAPRSEEWEVHLIDTGYATNTGGRVRRLREHIGSAPFFLTYGDGVSNVDLDALAAFHARSGATATLTAVRPPARFGNVEIEGNRVTHFAEKPQAGEGWINGGFMVVNPEALDLLRGDDDSFERDALEPLARQGRLAAFPHEGFWQCMDTLRDKRLLESLWAAPNPPWKTWT